MPPPPSPGRRAARIRLGRTVLALVGTAILAGIAGLVVTVFAPDPARGIVAMVSGAAAVLLAVAAALATYGLVAARQLRDRIATTDATAARLADEALPALVERLGAGASLESALAEVTDPAQLDVLRRVGQELRRVERMRVAAVSACGHAAGRVQALVASMLADLRDMEERHGEDVLGDLLKLDHSTAQAGRLADSIAVLTGARSGRRWTKPIVLESVLRGAVGRISAYQRVVVHSTCGVAVVGHAAEGVMHALAELMDNATRFSPPSEQVHVYVEEVRAGVVVTVEDGGLVMDALALRRAERAVSSGSLDLTGARLGLAVVGGIAAKYGLTVSFRPSSRGGTGVVVMIPTPLITEPRRAPTPADDRAVPAIGHPPAAAADEGGTDEPLAEPAGLPRRRRGETLAAVIAASSGVGRIPPVPPKPRSDAGAAFGAFHRGSRGIRGNLPDPTSAQPRDRSR